MAAAIKANEWVDVQNVPLGQQWVPLPYNASCLGTPSEFPRMIRRWHVRTWWLVAKALPTPST